MYRHTEGKVSGSKKLRPDGQKKSLPGGWNKAGISLAVFLMLIAVTAIAAFIIISAVMSRQSSAILSANKENARKAVHAAIMQKQTDSSGYMYSNTALSETLFQCSYDVSTQTVSPDQSYFRAYDISGDITGWSVTSPAGVGSKAADIWYVGIESDGTVLLAAHF